jgi:single stranded DNA-binding protein
MPNKRRNNCEFVGNLVRDVEMRYTQGGTALAKFTLAVSNDYKKDDEWVKQPASFLDFVAWGEKAESLAAFTKGQALNVESQAQLDSWEDKETGAKRSKVMFKVWDYEVVERTPKEEAVAEKPKSNRGRPKKVQAVVEDDEDIPF